MEEPYKIKRKIVKVGNAKYVSIPASWLKQQAERFKKKVVEFLDIFIYDKYMEIKPSKN